MSDTDRISSEASDVDFECEQLLSRRTSPAPRMKAEYISLLLYHKGLLRRHVYLGNMHTSRSHWVVREHDFLFDKKEGNYLHNRCLRSLRRGMLSAKMLQAKFITAAVSGALQPY